MRVQNSISIMKQKNGSIERKDGIKVSSKLSSANTKYLASCVAPGTYGSKGLGKPKCYSPDFPKPHNLSLGKVHLIVSGFPQQMFLHLQNPEVFFTVQITLSSKLHKLPFWSMPRWLLTLPHIAQSQSFLLKIGWKVPVILCLYFIHLKNYNHRVGAKTSCPLTLQLSPPKLCLHYQLLHTSVTGHGKNLERNLDEGTPRVLFTKPCFLVS